MRELGAANWLIRYDAALREREKERACERDAKAFRPGNSESGTSLIVASAWNEASSIPRRRRMLPTRFVPLFAPDLRPAPRLLRAASEPNGAPSPEVPDIEVVFSETETEACSYPTLAELESEQPPIVHEVERCGALETSPYPTLAELEDSSPAPPVVLEGVTEPMAMPSFGFDIESSCEESPCPLVPISLSEDILLGGCTEPMFPPEPSSRVVFIVVDKNVERAASVTPTPNPQLEAPSAPLRLSLSPPPLLLTPPHWAPVAAEAQAPMATGHALPRLLPTELPNPWALATRPNEARLESENARPRLSRSVISRFGRAAVLTFFAVLAGAGVRSAVLYARPGLLRAPTPVSAAGVSSPPVASPNATSANAPMNAPATGTPSTGVPANGTATGTSLTGTPSNGLLASDSAAAARPEGDVEVLAPNGVPVLVDGIPRGNGPRVALRVAPGYHMIRAGAKRTQLTEVRAGSLARVDLSTASD